MHGQNHIKFIMFAGFRLFSGAA